MKKQNKRGGVARGPNGERGQQAMSATPASNPDEAPLGKPSLRADRQEFFLPVTGFVWVFPESERSSTIPRFKG